MIATATAGSTQAPESSEQGTAAIAAGDRDTRSSRAERMGGTSIRVSSPTVSASGWSRSSGISRASVKTASWFPVSGVFVKTSAMT